MPTKQTPPCPECEKLAAVSEESNKIGEFLSWLLRKYDICEFIQDFDDDLSGYAPVRNSINQWLADYYGIDLDKVERERRALLDWLRESNG